jgi:hypothetical protein
LGLIYRQYNINFQRWGQGSTCSDILS